MKTSPHLNPKHFEGKTLAELQKSLQQALDFAGKYSQFLISVDQFGWHNEYRQELKRRIAEHIGKKS